jgi:hypothetical protein
VANENDWENEGGAIDRDIIKDLLDQEVEREPDPHYRPRSEEDHRLVGYTPCWALANDGSDRHCRMPEGHEGEHAYA